MPSSRGWRRASSGKQVLTKKDDALLFDMANNFGIRHFNEQQRGEYDTIWLSWMFHFYLATIHAGTRFIDEQATARPAAIRSVL